MVFQRNHRVQVSTPQLLQTFCCQVNVGILKLAIIQVCHDAGPQDYCNYCRPLFVVQITSIAFICIYGSKGARLPGLSH